MCIDRIMKLVIPSMLLGGCAAGGAVSDRGLVSSELLVHRPGPASDSSTVQLTLTAPAESPAGAGGFPVAEDPQLPTADLQFHRIWDEAGDTASADIKLCVAPDGHVNSAGLVRGSSSITYNRALVNDALDWRFSKLTKPSGPPDRSGPDQRCEIATVVYLPHA